MIVLPKGAVIVKQRIKEFKNDFGLILDDAESLNQKFNDGEIIYTAPELKHLQLKKIVFRENYAEPINIDGADFLYFRDVESSMYYIVEE